MSIYQKFVRAGLKITTRDKLFKYGFNLSPMYRRSTARIIDVSKDLFFVKIKLAISYKNKNYVNSIFGGSMFSATDPILMIQLINILGEDYVVWDKSAEISFKRPAKENLYAEFIFNNNEIEAIKHDIALKNETEITKTIKLTNKDESALYCVVKKVIYIANKSYYKNKRKT